ncbi:MAG TPA: AraC family transcriptional regulator [Stellaceae bacterium]|nr:AraC family transcriptional regulator [Stellaceae bacterium]
MHAARMSLSIRSYDGLDRVHAHDFHQIVLPVIGAMKSRVGEATGAIADRSGAMIVSGTPHEGYVLGENRFVVFEVPRKSLLPESVVACAAREPFFAIDEPLDHLARYVSGEASAGTLDGTLAHHASALLADSIGRRFAGRANRTPPIARALEIIAARYAEPLTVAEIARAAGMGLSRFHEQFRSEIGLTPAEQLAATRLDHAEDLLRETRLPIAEIALEVGFSDQTALTRCFRRRRGVTPAALRRGFR